MLPAGSVACADAPAFRIDFVKHIQPVLAQNCFTCHGPDESTREAELRLDLPEGLLGELEGGAVAVVPHRPDESELYLRLLGDEYSRMPPIESTHSLSEEQIDLFRRWIEQGAVYRSHWSFEPLDPGQPLGVSKSPWVRNEIDRFILARLEPEGIEPSPEANRETLIRRLSLDLTGLPPTPEEVGTFVDAQEPDAYEQLVDRLLASPSFSERWARHWLDLARYADSDGYLGDNLRANVYRYRDWVIDAINQDMPFDRFTIEQIAGDLLEGATLSQKIATGFHRNTMKNTEAGADRELDRAVRTVERVSTVGSVWLGLTVGCAECHSHKFDPLSQREFYQLVAFFDNLEDVDVKAPTPDDPKATAATIAEAEERRETFVHFRGDFRRRGAKVKPDTPGFLHPLQPRERPADRLDLAHWLVDCDNPLTARTAVNRYWKYLFGGGIVDTVDNLGISGESPSHSQLLDWLASEFIRRGWSRKELVRLIVTSATYRQASTSRADLIERDPQNRLLARQSSFRLEAEIVRDIALLAGGLLDRSVGGASIRPPLSANVTAVSRNQDWEVSQGADRYRRGLYILVRRATPYPMLMTFDAPDTTASCARRDRSNSPLQALTLLNDPVFVECAQHFGMRLSQLKTTEPKVWITEAFRRCISRRPTVEELARLTKFYDENRRLLDSIPDDDVHQLVGASLVGIEPREQAARCLVARCLLNLDEAINRE